jgi:hypothetical protein
MSTEYIWFKGGKESKRTADPKGEKPTLVKSGNGREIKYSYHYDMEADYDQRIIGASSETHLLNGEKDREGGKPAFIAYDVHGKVLHRAMWEGGVKQLVEWLYEDGGIYWSKYYTNGELHREGDKPAQIYYYFSGEIRNETWYDVEGAEHRDDDKPAFISYFKDGSVNQKRWYNHGNMHRGDDQPAVITYDIDGNVEKELYVYDGEVYTPQK